MVIVFHMKVTVVKFHWPQSCLVARDKIVKSVLMKKKPVYDSMASRHPQVKRKRICNIIFNMIHLMSYWCQKASKL